MTFMSSPKTARGKKVRANTARKMTARGKKAAGKKTASAKSKTPAKMSTASAQATELAAIIERGLASGHNDVVSEQALQDLLAALCKSYSARVEAGHEILPVRGRTALNSTDIMITASGLLKAANLAVFELGMWQSWTGR
jgi:hypothetical protein